MMEKSRVNYLRTKCYSILFSPVGHNLKEKITSFTPRFSGIKTRTLSVQLCSTLTEWMTHDFVSVCLPTIPCCAILGYFSTLASLSLLSDAFLCVPAINRSGGSGTPPTFTLRTAVRAPKPRPDRSQVMFLFLKTSESYFWEVFFTTSVL